MAAMTGAERAKLYRDRKRAAVRAGERAARLAVTTADGDGDGQRDGQGAGAGAVPVAPAGPGMLRILPPPPEPEPAEPEPPAGPQRRASRQGPDWPPPHGSGIDPETGEWTPAFRGQRPPFTETSGLHHGTRSPVQIADLADTLAAELLDDDATPDYLRDPAYRHAIKGWARAEAVCELAWDWLADQPDIESVLSEITTANETERRTGKVVKRTMNSRRVANVLDVLGRFTKQAATCREQLGLSPMGRARLGKAVTSSAVDMAALMSAITDRREQAQDDALEQRDRLQLQPAAAAILPATAGLITPGGMRVPERA
jgi:hypothetical protein